MEIICLQHVRFEGPGRFQEWCDVRGEILKTVFVPEDELPAIGTFKAVIIMGGPMNIYQHRDFPWLPKEKAFVRECLDRGVPVIGICLGAQLLADSLGAQVFQNPEREIGWYPVMLSEEIRSAFPEMPGNPKVLHWHGDTFQLPVGSKRVASSEACSEQGFWIPEKCLGLQFHPEATSESIEALIENCADELKNARFVQKKAALLTDRFDHEFEAWSALFEDVIYGARNNV